jgi:ATP-dependent helicase HrpB
LQGDLSLAFCLQAQEFLREDLKLLVMSATLGTPAVAALLGNAPAITSEGRSFPVDIRYLPAQQVPGDRRQLPELMALKIIDLVHAQAGSPLAFLPGVGQMRRSIATMAIVII